ncbi:hypothetical protein BDY19DRAFT_987312 [Irpex rosettiformis]|uniref:Uncharacterized protein n=1 Tax=Irpex rosettiformis TaxID=378272 RepID=A0ACB8TSB2_9APHY|nr:hypothetical protein BDY19DRAFT_987312 [Irpex rosettiformis]
MSTTKRSADAAFTVEDFPGTPESAPSPAASTSTTDYPPRKRSRSDVTPEERKEARAHRNRIAAQNSRDRRKAQFTYLERRVAELEEENRQLRAGSGACAVPEQLQQRPIDIAREKENQELRERIKTLEQGWDAVIKALAASGLPLAVPPPSSVTASSCLASAPLAIPATASPAQPIFPPSPAPSHSSSHGNEFDEFDSTRHLARVATTDAPLLSSLSPSPSALSTPQLSFSETSSVSAASPVDEGAMENLLREILAPSPLLSSTPLPITINTTEEASSPSIKTQQPLTQSTLDWEGEQEMQRLLDMLPDVQPDMKTLDINLGAAIDFSPSLDLDLSTWDMGSIPLVPVGAF